MKKKKLIFVKIIIYLLIFTVLACLIIYGTMHYLEEEKLQDIKADMLSVQCMCRIYKENNMINKSDNKILGVKLSECNKDIINNFKSKNIIDPNEYDKFYVLSDEDLDTLKANIETTPDTYYLINYDTWEVVTTKGYKGAYKFSDIMNLK